MRRPQHQAPRLGQGPYHPGILACERRGQQAALVLGEGSPQVVGAMVVRPHRARPAAPARWAAAPPAAPTGTPAPAAGTARRTPAPTPGCPAAPAPAPRPGARTSAACPAASRSARSPARSPRAARAACTRSCSPTLAPPVVTSRSAPRARPPPRRSPPRRRGTIGSSTGSPPQARTSAASACELELTMPPGRDRVARQRDLVPGRQDRHPGPAVHREPGMVRRRRQPDVARAQPPPGAHQHVARGEVLARRADVLAGRTASPSDHRLAVPRRVLLQQHASPHRRAPRCR